MPIKPLLLWIFSLTYVVFSHAATYEWVDEKGTTNYGDAVPSKYKHKAKIVDIKENVIVTPAAPSAKTERIEKIDQAKPIVLEAPAPKSAIDPADDSCAAQIQRYEESQLCFARHRNRRGGINEEGIRRCVAIPQPSCATDR